ncbi:MAG: DUF721 domain-containing protein [Pikeienuella sp.]
MADKSARPRKDRNPKNTQPASPKRRAKGFALAADLVAPTIKHAGAKRGFAELRLLTEWRVIVGEALAGVCRPIKVSYKGRTSGLGATLYVAAEGARAPELAMQEPQIIERVNQFYGYRAISRLSIDQSRAGMLSAGFADTSKPYEQDHPTQAEPSTGRIPIEGVTDERLRLALARLGANITAKSKRALPDADATADRSKI